MGITFGSKACIDPKSLAERCRQLGLPTDWVGLPNAYTCPLGCAPGWGHVLMARGDLDLLDWTARHDLIFQAGASTGPSSPGSPANSRAITLKSMEPVAATCITPGLRGDKNAAYLLWFADRRRSMSAIPINKAYNLRHPGDGATDTYHRSTTNSGTAWTWQGMINDIWGAASALGFNPTLPTTPDGTPEGFDFTGGYVLDALAVIFAYLGWALKLDPVTDLFTVQSIGADDADFNAATANRDGQRIWDAESIEPDKPWLPDKVRVLFPKFRAGPSCEQQGNVPWHPAERTDPYTVGSSVGSSGSATMAVIHDEMAAVMEATGLSATNQSAIDARAVTRAAAYYRAARVDSLYRAYADPISDTGLRPARLLKATCWGDRGGGMITETVYFRGMAVGKQDGLGAGLPGRGDGGGLEVMGSEAFPWGGHEMPPFITAALPLRSTRHRQGYHLTLDAEIPFPAKITGNDGGSPRKYSWTEQTPGASGAFSDRTNGRTGAHSGDCPAYETNGNTAVTDDTYVWMHRAYLPTTGKREYVFDYPASAAAGDGLIVEGEDPGVGDTTSITTPVVWLSFSLEEGFELSEIDLGDGTFRVRVGLQPASLTHAGTVTVGATISTIQNLGFGSKRVTGAVLVAAPYTSINGIDFQDSSASYRIVSRLGAFKGTSAAYTDAYGHLAFNSGHTVTPLNIGLHFRPADPRCTLYSQAGLASAFFGTPQSTQVRYAIQVSPGGGIADGETFVDYSLVVSTGGIVTGHTSLSAALAALGGITGAFGG